MSLTCFVRAVSHFLARFRACHSPQFVFALAGLLCLTACGGAPDEAATYAYVAPATVNLRGQLNQKTSAVAVLKHGERVAVVDGRRRFIKVRTEHGAEGWLDANDLLSVTEMDHIRQDRAAALRLPSEARATAYEALNIHLDPSRNSPAFEQIPEGAAVWVLARKVVPRDAGSERAPFVFERPKPPARHSAKNRKTKTALKPPLPRPPKPPADWQRVWGTSEQPESAEQSTPAAQKLAAPSARKAKASIPEDWLLVRTENKRTGWALARNLMMSIPDDVAQYAGGAHITSFFDLGTVNDERDGEKHNWLWTTAATAETADFDAWRVFLWNRRRHRFETSYRQHDLEGYFPIHVDPPEPAGPGRTFELITKDEDARMRRRTYHFDGVRVHLIATEDYRPEDLNASAVRPATNQKGGNWISRQWASWKQKLSGKR